VPFNSDTGADVGFLQGGATASSRFLDLDPNNIEEISVLKGLSATTLYGQAGRNGVVLVTTKSGSNTDEANKKFEINVSQSGFVTEIANLPDYQNTYGNGFFQNFSAAFSNLGPNFNVRGRNGIAEDGTVPHPYDLGPLNGAFPEFQGARVEYRPFNSVENFFTSGFASTTSVNAGGSSGKSSYNISFGFTDESGFVETSNFDRLNLSVGGSTQLANNFTIQSSFNFTRTNRQAPPASPAFGGNPADASLFSNVLFTPRSLDLIGLPFENPLDNSSVYYRPDIQNPLWTLNNVEDNELLNRFVSSITTTYKFTDYLNLSYRLAFDTFTQNQQNTVNNGGPQVVGGRYRTTDRVSTTFDHTFSLNLDLDISEKFNLSGNLGFNPRQERLEGLQTTSTQQVVFGLFDHNNFEATNAFNFFSEQNIVGTYASLTLGYDNYLFLNVQGRNDSFSSLPIDNRSIFYPSASISFLPSSVFDFSNTFVDYLKLRVGFGSSAGFPAPFSTVIGLNQGANVFLNEDGNAVNTLGISNVLGNQDLEPELIEEFEAGIEARFFKNRLSLDASVYDRRSNDLIIQNRPLDPATGFTTTADNIGEISNRGIEVGFSATPFRPKTDDGFRWDISGQWSVNENIVEDNGLEDGSINVFAGFGNLGNAAISGEAFGVIVGGAITRDENGNRVVSADGSYLPDNDISIIGDPNADWRATISNSFSWKGFNLGFQVEYTHGGDISSVTAAALLSRGLTTDTDIDRTQTFILPGVTQQGNINTTQIAFTQLAFENTGFFGIDELAIYDASVIRLREISFGYTFPKKFLDKTPFGNLSLTVIGQNLWFDAPNLPEGLNFDPEVNSLGVGNGQGFDFLTGPTSRRFGLSLKASF